MLKLKETTLVHSQIFVIIVVATMTLFGGMDLTVIQFAHAAAGHGPNDGGGTSPATPSAVSERDRMVFWVSGVLCYNS